MKKISLMIILISIFSAFTLNSSFREDQSRAISLQAAVGTVAKIYIEPISAQTSFYHFGMPFDIQDISVSPGASVGRPIAHWSVISNTPFKLTITTMEKLHHVDESEESGFNYDLTFSYDLSYYIAGELHSTKEEGETEFTISTLDVDKTRDIIPEDANPTSFVGSVDGTIYFRFRPDDGESSADFDDSINAAPAGNYEAQVVIMLKEK